MKRGLIATLVVSVLLVSVAAMWVAPVSAQTVPAASTRESPLSEAQREALQDIVASAARHEGDRDTAGAEAAADTARLLKAQTAAIQALSAQIKRLEARVALLEQQR